METRFRATVETKAPVKDRIARGAKKAAVKGQRRPRAMAYNAEHGLNGFVQQIRQATPMQVIETERSGVSAQLLKDLARRLNVPLLRLYEMLGVSKATAEKKAASNELLAGAGGQAAMGVAKLLAMAEDIVAESTAPQARGFDAGQWLGRWLDLPQPALGGRRPSELLDTPTGMSVVTKVLGAIDSGAYV